MNLAVHKLRVNVKSLAAEAKFIRQEIKRATDVDHKNELACHRSQRVKPEARLAQLAIAFLKGHEYHRAEPKTNNPVCSIELVNKLNKFVPYGEKVSQTQVLNWLT